MLKYTGAFHGTTLVVEYHSPQWHDLVEQGWVTMFINYFNGRRIATMRPKD